MSKNIIDENRLFNAALEEFINHSYDEASINRIIKQAGISKGSFYYRFENKKSLYISILKSCNQKKWDYIKQLMSNDSNAQTPGNIFDLFLYQAKLGIQFANAYPEYHLLSKMFSREKGKSIYQEALHAIGNSDDAGLKIMIKNAINNHDFNKKFSEDFLAKVISSLFLSFDELFFNNKEFDLDEAFINLENYVEFMKNGLSSK